MQFKRLQSKNGTSDLINKLEVVIDDDENYLVQIILMYDNCNNNIETLKNKVDKRYKNNTKTTYYGPAEYQYMTRKSMLTIYLLLVLKILIYKFL